MYIINCSFSGGATAVPTEIIDKHLKLAPAASFKVLLFILRNPDGAKDAAQISLCTGLTENEVKDCLEFWEDENVITKSDETNEEASQKAVANLKTSDSYHPHEQKNIRPATVKLPTQGEVSKRFSQEPELSAINAEAQLIIGTYGLQMQSVIVLLYDYYGFSPEIIITLLQYQKDKGNVSPNAVKNRGEEWAKKGIDSIELVQNELRSLSVIEKTYNTVKEYTGHSQKNPTPKMAGYLREWCIEWQFSDEMILFALKESGKSFAEANKLLKKWMLSGYTTPEQVEKKKKKSIPEKIEKSYDINKVGKHSILERMKMLDDEE